MDDLRQEFVEIKEILNFNRKYGLSVIEASIYSGIGRKRIEELCQSGELDYKEVSRGKKIITKDAIKRYLEG